MKIENVPFQTIDWEAVTPVVYPGQAGLAVWRTVEAGNIRVRMVEYSPGYEAAHWCRRGHVVLCLAGEIVTTLDDGRNFTLKAGQTYQVAEEAGAHRSSSAGGATLFIVD